jgi:hypothetical protein
MVAHRAPQGQGSGLPPSPGSRADAVAGTVGGAWLDGIRAAEAVGGLLDAPGPDHSGGARQKGSE